MLKNPNKKKAKHALFDGMRGGNPTPTVRHIIQSGLYRCDKLRRPRIIDGRFKVRRLTIANLSGKLPTNYLEHADFIHRHVSNVAFYPDASFLIGDEAPRLYWDTLLARKIAITPWVWRELEDWLDHGRNNRYIRDILLRARDRRDYRILFTEQIVDPVRTAALKYYVPMLAVRKRLGAKLIAHFADKEGREPSVEELDRLLKSFAHNHEFNLIRKGMEDWGKDNFFADEELVASAAIDAILDRQHTQILTRDHDLEAQFLKMSMLLVHQYLAYLFAERYATDPSAFESIRLDVSASKLQNIYADHPDNVLVKTRFTDFDHFIDWLLPPERGQMLSVPIYCSWFGGDGAELAFSPLSFNTERGMALLLQSKAATGGLNSDKLGELNCHVISFTDDDDPTIWVTIAKDQNKGTGHTRLAMADVIQADADRLQTKPRPQTGK